MDSIYATHKPSQGSGDYLRLKDGDKVKVRFASKPAIVTYDGDKIRYQWIVLNRTDGKAQIYEAGPQVFGQLASLYPEWGEPTDFDVTIGRTGSGQFDTSYTVTPSPKSLDLSVGEEILVNKVAETFPGKKSKWLEDYAKDAVLPETIERKSLPKEGAPELGDDDIPPEYR